MTLPTPPWHRPGKKPSARPALSQEAIVDAALRILDAEGLDAVTMRRIADELGTGPASLYAHVANKDELYELLLDRISGEIRLPDPGGDWQDRLKAWVREAERVLVSHRDIARIAMGRIPTGPNTLASTEALLGILRSAGLPDQTAAWACDILPQYATASAYEGGLYAERFGTEEKAREYFDQVHTYFSALPAGRFPNIHALAGEMVAGDGTERFEFGLDLLIKGLAAQV